MNWQQLQIARNTVRVFEDLGRAYGLKIKVDCVDLRRGWWQPKGDDKKTGLRKWNNMAYGHDIPKQEYCGHVEKKLPSGWGRWSIEGPERLEYEGYWEDGFPHGHGTFLLDGAIVYQGPVLKGRPSGQQGSYYWADGTRYTGRLTKGRFDGQGTIQRGNMVYVDFWNGGLRSGQGTFYMHVWAGLPPLWTIIQ